MLHVLLYSLSSQYAGFVNDKVHVQSVHAELDYRAKTKETEELTLLPRPKAVGIHLSKNEGIVLITKKTKHRNRPASNKNEVLWSSNKSGPKSVFHLDLLLTLLHLLSLFNRIYKGIANYTAKQGYRADLRQEAIARASTIRQSQRPKKDAREKKVRGAKAKDAADKA